MHTSSVCRKIKPLITVALPVFNGGKLLELSVRSIIAQTWENWELLILDDGSKDGAVDGLPFLSDSRIIVVRDGFNRGLSARLNQAVTMARGTYFARMDHDDVCHPERLRKQVEYLEENPDVDLLAAQCIAIDEQDTLVGMLPAVRLHEEICVCPWKGFYMPHPTWMGRITWFRNFRYQEPAPYCCEDQELLLRAYKHSRFYVLPEYLLAYRVRIHPSWKKQLRTRLAFLKVQTNIFLHSYEWKNAFLSLSIAAARIIFDAWHELRCLSDPNFKRGWGKVSQIEQHKWAKWILMVRTTENYGWRK